MIATKDLTDAEVQRIIRRLGSRQRSMIRALRRNGAMRFDMHNDFRVAESLANRGMPLVLQARSTFALTSLGVRVAELLD